LLPVVLAARLQHGCIVYNTDFHDTLTPDMLPGKKVGVRAYSQTTGAWVRNILAQEHGIDLPSIRWITFEGAHLDAYQEPAYVTRAPEDGKDLLGMLMAGEVDAGILGNDLPDDPKIKPVIANAAEAGRAWFAKHGLVPINHMLVVTKDLASSRPDIVREIYDLFKRSKAMAAAKPGAADMRPIGFKAIGPSLELVIDLAHQQQLIPRRFSVAELFEDARTILGPDA
jgi:4,5-dihydroxyphthalate decarboxylase